MNKNTGKYKTLSLANLIGLVFSICAAFIIYLLVSYQFRGGSYTKEKEQEYRLIYKFEPGETANSIQPAQSPDGFAYLERGRMRSESGSPIKLYIQNNN